MPRPYLLLETMIISSLLLAGCAEQGKHVDAYIQVSRDAFESDEHYRIFKQTQCELLQSAFVLNRVGGKANEIKQELQVRNQEDELILIRLPVAGRGQEEAEKLVNGIIQTYQSEVVNRDRLKQVEELSKLRKRYNDRFQSIMKTSDELKQLAERLSERFGNDTEIEKKHLVYLLRRKVDLLLEKTSGKEIPGIDAQIQLVAELIDSSRANIAKSSNVLSGELQARQEVLKGLKRELQAIQDAKSKLEMNIDKGSPVRVIQKALVN